MRGTSPHLLRSYIQHALYSRASGYFSAKQVVGGLRESLPFATLRDEAAYREAARTHWNTGDSGSAWLTPCEIFTPYYGEAIARSIVARHKRAYGSSEPLQLLEIGGGNGTFAADVLRFLRREEPDLFSRCKYLLVEISESLADVQRRNLSDLGAERVEVIHSCASEWAAERSSSQQLEGPWFITLLEVLDNLPHDRLRVSSSSSLEEAVVAQKTPGDELRRPTYSQSFRPLSDPELFETAELLELTSIEALQSLHDDNARTTGAASGSDLALELTRMTSFLLGETGRGETSTGGPTSQDVLVPTGCYTLLKALCGAVKEPPSFTIADFSWLPPQPDGAINAPVVQVQRSGQTIDLRGDYLKACGDADILFPTNFEHLATMVQAASGSSGGVAVSSSATAEFMKEWSVPYAQTATQSGYDPLVDDFSNTRILVSG